MSKSEPHEGKAIQGLPRTVRALQSCLVTASQAEGKRGSLSEPVPSVTVGDRSLQKHACVVARPRRDEL